MGLQGCVGFFGLVRRIGLTGFRVVGLRGLGLIGLIGLLGFAYKAFDCRLDRIRLPGFVGLIG